MRQFIRNKKTRFEIISAHHFNTYVREPDEQGLANTKVCDLDRFLIKKRMMLLIPLV